MGSTLANKKIFLEILQQSVGNGEMKELKEKLVNRGLSLDVIADLEKELNLVGVISHGYDGLGQLRYKITDFGKEYCDTFSSFERINKELDAIKIKYEAV